LHLAATIERAEKQLILARQGRRLLSLLGDMAVVPGEPRPVYENEEHARQVLEEAERELKAWQPRLEPITSGGAREETTAHDSGVEGDASSEQEYDRSQSRFTEKTAAA
jgi:hypothetical protein